MKPIACSNGCGRKTTEPFLIRGNLLCTICAELIAPHIVSSRAVSNWRAFTNANRSVPTARTPRNIRPGEEDGNRVDN